MVVVKLEEKCIEYVIIFINSIYVIFILYMLHYLIFLKTTKIIINTLRCEYN